MNPSLAQVLQQHADETFPRECVGAILARDGVPVLSLELENVARDPERNFDVSARDYLRAERAAACTGHTVWGFYHSHPHGPAFPSRADQALERHGLKSVILISGAAGDPPRSR